MNQVRTISLAILLVSWITHGGDVMAWEQTPGSFGEGISWSTSCFWYSINENGSDDINFVDLQDMVRESFDAWEDVYCSYFYFVETEPTTIEKADVYTDKGNVNLLVWHEKAKDWIYDSQAIAMTTTYFDPETNSILDVDMEFNGVWFSFGTLDSVEQSDTITDLISTLTHEIGHTTGLDDLYRPMYSESTMFGFDAQGATNKRTLHSDDIEGLCTLYPVDDDPEICEAPNCGLDLFGNSDSCEWNHSHNASQSSSNCQAIPGKTTSHHSLLINLSRFLTVACFTSSSHPEFD